MSCWSARWASRCSAPRGISPWRLVDVTQHFARLSEALVTLLSPHELTDHPQAAALAPKGGASIVFERISFAYPGNRHVFDQFNLAVEPGQKVGLIGPSGGGKSTLIALLQRFYDLPSGRILIDGHDISRATQESLRDAIAVVPQDAPLLNRSLMENIRYGRPEASDAEVWERVARGSMRRIHREPACGPRHHGGRPRRSIVRRSASARRDRASVLEELAHPSARRSYLSSRHRSRGGDPRRVFGPHAGTNRHRRRASVVDAAEF